MTIDVKNSPFTEEQVRLLNVLLSQLTPHQQIWLSGYLMAATSSQAPVLKQPEQANTGPVNVTVLYGSQTGNAQSLAEQLSEKLKAENYHVMLSSMDEFKPNALKKLQYLFLVVSTHGEGDPPDNAILFHEFLHSKRAPKLDGLTYSVLALGDSSYEQFCQTGKEFDERLAELGAVRLCPRVDCDLDFEEPASEWFDAVLTSLRDKQNVKQPAASVAASSAKPSETYSRSNPFHAEVLENINLNGRGSNKETRHLELSIEGANFQFEPGDSLGIIPENDPVLVDAIIEEMGWKDELVAINKNGDELPIRDALLKQFEITVLTKPLIEKAISFSRTPDNMKKLLNDDKRLKEYVYGRDLLDFIRDFSLSGVNANEFVSILRKIPPRLYSISSSLKANPDEVHLTIGKVQYHAHGRGRFGVCSGQCADRIEIGDTLPVYVHQNPNFRLPNDPDVPIIMIGAGTGVAPYRAFLQEREEIGAQGKAWLFFGEQHFLTDFLYQVEWQRWLNVGVLSKIDLAFSRDTDRKIYVQHRMLEKSKEVFEWIQEGAVVYVCGDEKRMAKDVHETLQQIFMQEGEMSEDEAKQYLQTMQKEKRYQRDVY